MVPEDESGGDEPDRHKRTQDCQLQEKAKFPINVLQKPRVHEPVCVYHTQFIGRTVPSMKPKQLLEEIVSLDGFCILLKSKWA